MERCGGWFEDGKPRFPRKTISAGSIFEFGCETHNRELALSLAALEYHAVGGFKSHGCGQILVENHSKHSNWASLLFHH